MRYETPEQVAGAIGSLAVGECLDPLVRRAGIKLAAERFGFIVTDRDGAALQAAADELGVDLPDAPEPADFGRPLAPVDQDGERVDRPEPAPRELAPFSIEHARALRSIRVDHAERVDVDRFEIRKPAELAPEAELGFARGLELLRIVSKPIPGRDGWRRSGDGREWYSADWLGGLA